MILMIFHFQLLILDWKGWIDSAGRVSHEAMSSEELSARDQGG